MGLARRLTRGRQTLLLVLLPIASVAVVLLAAEVLLRINLIPNEYYVRNQVIGRDREGPALLILGDSFMASLVGGDIVDLLDAQLQSGYRIRNTARAGTGPVQYLENLRREGEPFDPDVILLSYYVGNDLMDVGCWDLEGRLRPPARPPLWQRSYLAQFVGERLRARFPGRAIFFVPGALWGFARPAPPPAAPRQEVDYDAMRAAGIPEHYIDSARAGKINPWIVSFGANRPDYYRDVLLVESECARQAWSNAERVLNLILDEAARLDVPVLPVIFPNTLQVSTAHHELYRAWKIDVDDAMLGSNRPQRLLAALFRSRGLAPLDLFDAFRSSTEPLYWEMDEHMNTRGQEMSARLIAEALRRQDAEPRIGDAASSSSPLPAPRKVRTAAR